MTSSVPNANASVRQGCEKKVGIEGCRAKQGAVGSPAPVNATISQYCGYEEEYPYKLDSSEAAKHAHGRVTPFVTVVDLTVRFTYAARGDPRAAVCTRETIRVHSQTELVRRFGSSQLVSTRFAFQSSTSNTCVLPSSTARTREVTFISKY